MDLPNKEINHSTPYFLENGPRRSKKVGRSVDVGHAQKTVRPRDDDDRVRAGSKRKTLTRKGRGKEKEEGRKKEVVARLNRQSCAPIISDGNRRNPSRSLLCSR